MSFLLDASAIIPLVMQTGKSVVTGSKRAVLHTTELGIYEACNGFWKLATLVKTVNPEDAAEMIAVLSELAKRNLAVISFARIDLHKTLQVATQSRLTFYDASYIIASQQAQAVLVTDDKKLCSAAARIVKSVTFKEFQERIGKPIDE